MLTNSILVLATLGNIFVNSFIYQQERVIDKGIELLGQSLPHSQPTLQIASTAKQQGNKLVNANLGVPFQLKVNQTATIKSENLKIKFLEVTSDSRCPADVECIWAGEVTIVVDILKNSHSLGKFSLSSLTKSEITLDNYSIKFTNVSSGLLLAGQPIEQSDYVVTLVVSKI